MPQGRPAIPADVKRAVLVEAGHRCAIPTCRQIPVEIAHIVPWERVRTHEFSNLIALCPTCHNRYDANQIDRKSMATYKANLSILSSRYNDMERRVLEAFADYPARAVVHLTGSWSIAFKYLLLDGLLEPVSDAAVAEIAMSDGSSFALNESYAITAKGREFVAALRDAQPIDAARVLDQAE